MKKILFLYLITFLIPQTSFAVESSQGPDLLAAIFKMFWVLALVLAIIFVCIHFLKKMNLARSGLFGANKLMNVVETLHLGPKNSIAAVKAGSDYILVGISGNQINYLTKLEMSPEILLQVEGKKSSNGLPKNSQPYGTTQKSVILLTEKIKEKLTSRKSDKIKKSA